MEEVTRMYAPAGKSPLRWSVSAVTLGDQEVVATRLTIGGARMGASCPHRVVLGKREVPKGTLRSILTLLDISLDEFLKALR